MSSTFTSSGSPADDAINILTATEASQALRCQADDAVMLGLLPLVDEYIHKATGRDWTQDAVISPTAKAAARMLLVQWYENPAMYASGMTSLDHGLAAVLGQLEAEALKYRKFEFYGLDGAGTITLAGARVGDEVIKLVGIYGVDGDQSEDFEETISVAGAIQQKAEEDLTENLYALILKNPGEEVEP